MNQQADMFYPEVERLCLERIQASFNPERQLFDLLLATNEQWLPTADTEDASSTVMVLLALHRANIPLESLSIDADKVFKALAALFKDKDYLQNIGLLFWLDAVYQRQSVSERLNSLGLDMPAVLRYCREIKTSELAWILSGLSHALLREDSAELRQFAHAIFTLLQQRFNAQSHLFYHTADNAPLKFRLRRRVGTFADQIYGIQAFAFAKLANLDTQGLSIAQACADKIIVLQGDKGQWWWHYDAVTGHVAQPYPVYSVHQHGMAPMSLMALMHASGANYEPALEESRAWLRNNELNVDMWDAAANTFWRDIEYDQHRFSDLSRKAASVSGFSAFNRNLNVKLKVNRVTWPYEWAWCLYAGAIATHDKIAGHLV